MSKNLKLWKDLIDTFLSGFDMDFDSLYDYYTKQYKKACCGKTCKKTDESLGTICTCDFSKNFLVDNNDNYKLTMDVNPKATAKNITIDLEDNQLTIEYKFKDGNCTTANTVIETLPSDADENEITATVEDGKLVIVIAKIPVAVEPYDKSGTEEDTKNVKINRK